MMARAKELGAKLSFTQEQDGKKLVLTFQQRNSGRRRMLPDTAAEITREYHGDLYPRFAEFRMTSVAATA